MKGGWVKNLKKLIISIHIISINGGTMATTLVWVWLMWFQGCTKTRKERRNVDVGINAGDDGVGGKEQRNDEPHLARRHQWDDGGVFVSPKNSNSCAFMYLHYIHYIHHLGKISFLIWQDTGSSNKNSLSLIWQDTGGRMAVSSCHPDTKE